MDLLKLLVRAINAPLSLHDQQKLDELLKHRQGGERFYKYICDFFSSGSVSEMPGKESVRRRIEERINNGKEIPAVKRSVRPVWFRAGIAALVLLGLGVAVILFKAPVHNQQVLTYTEVSVPLGQRSKLFLPDSTLVYLNAGTTLKYASDFGAEERKVWLDGEAYFQVKKQDGRAFRVLTDEVEITVKGTVFNVKDYDNDREVITQLFEGQIELGLSAIGKRLLMTPGHKVIYNTDEGIYKEVESDRNNCDWLDGVYRFEDEHLENLVNMLNRVFNTDIRFRNESLKQYRYTGVISEKKGLQRILLLLQVSADIRIEYENNLIYLSK